MTEPNAPNADRRQWSAFTRDHRRPVEVAVRALAAAHDPGVYGQGVEVVVESPPLHWWQRFRDRRERDRARIAVTGEAGIAAYPIHVRLVTSIGADAAGRVQRRDRWVASVTVVAPAGSARSAGDTGPAASSETIMTLKRGTTGGYDLADAAAEVVAGTVAALDDLHPFSPRRGWRFRVDRHVRRS